MSDLDTQLKEIFPLLDWSNNQIDPIGTEEAIKRIKQAFKDDGWIAPQDFAPDDSTDVAEYGDIQSAKSEHSIFKRNVANIIESQGAYSFVGSMDALKKDENLMTGQEWYDRFDTYMGEAPLAYSDYDVIVAAKKAAGIE